MSQSGASMVILTSIYTLTPTHCGLGSTVGAIDLPIARESHSGLPILPASGLKGAARAALDESKLSTEAQTKLFGPKLKDADGLSAGALAFTEARLLALPVRSFVRPWLYVTAPCLIDRLNRDLRALGLEHKQLPLVDRPQTNPGPVPGQAYVSSQRLASQALVLEDLIFPAAQLSYSDKTAQLAKDIAGLLPSAEEQTQARIREGLVVVSDDELTLLLEHCIPVQARIRLDENKTTSGAGGNLWYEEQLPSDCLFTSFVMLRPGYQEKDKQPLEQFKAALEKLTYFQLGGNETVGMGLCWWTAQPHGATTNASGGSSGTTGGSRPPSSQKGGSSVAASSQAKTPEPPKATFSPSSRRPLSLSGARQVFLAERLFPRGSASDEVKTLLQGLPIQLRQQGLLVVVADLIRRKGASERLLLEVMAQWLLQDCPLQLVKEKLQNPAVDDLLQTLLKARSRDEYQTFQAEAFQLLEQSKLLSKAL